MIAKGVFEISYNEDEFKKAIPVVQRSPQKQRLRLQSHLSAEQPQRKSHAIG